MSASEPKLPSFVPNVSVLILCALSSTTNGLPKLFLASSSIFYDLTNLKIILIFLYIIVPGAPEDITVAHLAETNSIILSWIVKCENGIIQEYRIEYFRVDDSSGSKTLSTRVSKIQIGSLPAGKTLRFQVHLIYSVLG